MTDKQQPEALRLAEYVDDLIDGSMVNYEIEDLEKVAAELRRLHAYCQELEAQVIRDCMTHVQKPAEIEHVAGDVSKNKTKLNMSTQQPTQPAPVQDYPPLPDFDTVEQHIYGACRRYITQDMLEPIHNLIRETVDADRVARKQGANHD